MEFHAELSVLIVKAITILGAVVFAILSTGIVDYKTVLGPEGLNIKSPPTQILLIFLTIFVLAL